VQCARIWQSIWQIVVVVEKPAILHKNVVEDSVWRIKQMTIIAVHVEMYAELVSIVSPECART
jgi:hypothetical protein